MKRSTLRSKLSLVCTAAARRLLIACAALLMLAVYAPAHAQTFGKTIAGAIPSDGLRADYKRGSKFALTEQGTVTELCAYLDGQGGITGAQAIRFVLYRDAGGTPGTKIGESEAMAVASGAGASWNCLKTPYLVPSPGNYWIMLHSGTDAGVVRYYYDGPANWYGATDTFGDGASGQFGAGGTGDGTLSVYAAYATSDQIVNWGRTTVGANPSGGMRADYKRGSLLSIDAPGRALAFSVYMDGLGGGTGHQDVTITLYFGGPDNVTGDRFLYYTANVRIAAGMKPQWITIPVAANVFENMPGLSLVGGHFWLTLHSGGNAGVARFYSDGTGNWCGHADVYSDGPDNDFGSCDAGNGTISAFISFEPGEFKTAGSIGNLAPIANATPSSGMTANYIRGSRFTVAEDGASLHSLAAYLDGLGGGTGAQQVQMLVYNDLPLHGLVLASKPVTITAGSAPRMYDFLIDGGVRLTPGDYYLMLFSGENNGVARNYSTPQANWYGKPEDFANGPPSILLEPPPAPGLSFGTVTLLVNGRLRLPSESD